MSNKDLPDKELVDLEAQNNPGNPEQKELDSDTLSSNPVLKKIGRLLTNSSAQEWKSGGALLTAELRIPRPIQIHEFVYIRDLGEKSLIARVATPVTCQYAAGGYRLIPVTAGAYFIEIRDRVFDPDKLVDPKYTSNFKGKFHEILASGDVARKLFRDIHALVRGNSKNFQREFEEKAQKSFDALLDCIEKGEISEWRNEAAIIDGRDTTTYSFEHNELQFSSIRSVEGWDAQYELQIKQNKFEMIKSGSMPKLIFNALEKMQQNSQLGFLEKKLLELGLKDDE